MNKLIENLLERVEKGSHEEKVSCLIDIGDYIEDAHPIAEDLLIVVQRLINIAARETDRKALRLLFRNISVAYQQTVDLSEVSFEPLISGLDKAEPLFICNVLYLLSMTCHQKYVPVLSKYLSHPDEKVRGEAEDALTWLGKS